MKKVTIILMTLLWSAIAFSQTTATQKHEILSGETLYGIAGQYNVSVDDLLKLNPGLQADHIMAGQRINVPARAAQQSTTQGTAQGAMQQQVLRQVRQQVQQKQVQPDDNDHPRYKTSHEVKKKETLYSISRQYGITVDQLIEANPSLKDGKLKKGSTINIPYTADEEAQFQAERQRAIDEANRKRLREATIRVAMVLPFAKAEEKMTAESQKMVNLYQGFLLAVDSLKQRGYNVEVFAYDEVNPSTTVSAILQKPEMKDMQLIVGPMRQWNVKAVADFAHENHIAHVVPLSNELSLVNEHPTTFQLNVHNSLIYDQVYDRFHQLHKDHNIIFVGMNDRSEDMSYIADFKKALEEKGIKYSNASATDFATVRDVLKKGVRNIIIPTSSSASAFDTMCKKLDGLELTSDYTVQLFGYPEWLTLPARHEKSMSKYQCQFFTSFYSNAASSRVQQFNSHFRRWFNQDQYNSFPKYGELGYDIGAYFIKGLKDYGTNFYEDFHKNTYQSLEFPMAFEKKNSWSGYQNRSMLIVTHRTDGTVSVR